MRRGTRQVHGTMLRLLLALTAAGALLALAWALPWPGGGPRPAVVSGDPEGGLLVLDTFKGRDRTRLADHAPDEAPEGSAWTEVRGVWRISASPPQAAGKGRVVELTGADTDQRAVIDSGEADVMVEAEITWRSGYAGLVARYQDEANWLMAWFDGVGDVVVGQRLNGEFSELGRTAYHWGAPGTTRLFQVAAIGPAVVVAVDGATLLRRTAPELQAGTSVGLFSRESVNTSFDSFRVLSAAGPKSPPRPSGVLVSDDFKDRDGTSLSLHAPDVAPEGRAWWEARGIWKIATHPPQASGTGMLVETTAADTDQRAVIDSGEADVMVEAEITWRSGYAGLVARYQDEANWLMAWFDGVGDMVVGQRLNGEFRELGRTAYHWGAPGTTRRFQVTARGHQLAVAIDGETILRVTASDASGATQVGLFSRESRDTLFDRLEASRAR